MYNFVVCVAEVLVLPFLEILVSAWVKKRDDRVTQSAVVSLARHLSDFVMVLLLPRRRLDANEPSTARHYLFLIKSFVA